MRCEECGSALYAAGAHVPAGTYVRVDDGSFKPLALTQAAVLPASFDGHVALYRAAAPPCACQYRAWAGAAGVTPRGGERHARGVPRPGAVSAAAACQPERPASQQSVARAASSGAADEQRRGSGEPMVR